MSKLKGIIFVLAGAISYGLLATFVRLAYADGYSAPEVTFSQYATGWLALGLLMIILKPKQSHLEGRARRKEMFQLMLGGTSYGLTGLFYYISVNYVPVSVAVVLLMQAIWMGVVLEALLQRRFPSGEQIISIVVALAGTAFAARLIQDGLVLNVAGVAWGMAAAVTYTIALTVAGKLAPRLNVLRKTFYVLTGSTVAVLIAGSFLLSGDFSISVFWKWGLLLALLGSVLPPLLFNQGFPHTGIGLGSILISIEIPVSVLMAAWLLNEKVGWLQILGVGLIILSIVIINKNFLLRRNKN